MIRLSEEDTRKLAAVRLVLMDVDGTLVTAEKTDFDNVIRQLRKLKAVGIGFSIATGRSIAGVKFVADQLHTTRARLPPMITYNGAVVIAGQDNSLIEVERIDRGAYKALTERCCQLALHPLVYACRLTFDFTPQETVYSDAPCPPDREFNGMPVQRVPDLASVEDEFVAVLVEMKDPAHGIKLTAELEELFKGKLRVTTSGGRFVEISAPTGTKAHAMRRLARMRGVELSQILAIGDSYNDLEMLKHAGIAAAVANAPEAVRETASIKCTQSAGKGVVEVLRHLTRVVRSPLPNSQPALGVQ
jgi:Cof subfamily protein (haloacid dehalogenase superfamily)